MPTTTPDHIIVAARTLDEGVAWVESRLGVSMSPRRGGEHDRQATHNALLSLGPDFYLEVIAINPNAPVPSHPRWFGMDALDPIAPPSLHHWVSQTDNLEAALSASAIKTGVIEPMTRGTLRWLITIAEDGSLQCDGTMPSLIEWQSQPHPATTLTDIGCRLVKLEVQHPRAAEMQESFDAIGMVDPRIQLAASRGPKLIATIDTPNGLRTL
jgi:hypothetical protein